MRSPARTLIFTGDGKGKTTAALGMVLRASGHGMVVKIIQFVKSDSSTGELAACGRLPGVEIVQTGRGFIPKPESARFTGHREAAGAGLRIAGEALASGRYDLVVLDEICTAVAKGLIDEQAVVDLITDPERRACVVMTGRGATEGLIAVADTVSVVECLKHGYDDGWGAQKGVEF